MGFLNTHTKSKADSKYVTILERKKKTLFLDCTAALGVDLASDLFNVSQFSI